MDPLIWVSAGGSVPVAAWLAYRLFAGSILSRYQRIERGLRESEHKYRALLTATNDSVILYEVRTGRIIDCNARAEELVGLRRQQLVGMVHLELYPPDEVDHSRQIFSEKAEAGGGLVRNLHIAHRNGYFISVDANIRPINLGGRAVVVVTLRIISGHYDPEEVLRQERSLGGAILETVQALVVVLDREAKIVRFNRTCESLTGYSLEQVRGRYLWDFLVPSREVERVQRSLSALMESELANGFESPWATRHGTERLVAWSNSAVRDGDGRVQYVIATGVDMTARKSAEEGLRRAHDEMEKRVVLRTAALRSANDALLQSEARLAEAQQIAHVGSWEWDFRFDRISWSDEVFRIFGMVPGEISPTFEIWLSLVHPDDRIAVKEGIETAVRGQTHLSLDYRLGTEGGNRVVHAEGVVSPGDSQRPQRMSGTVQDITDRKLAEEALRRAHDDLEVRVERRTAELRLANQALSFTQFAMDHAADAVFWLNNALQFIYVNDTACRFLGYDRDALLEVGISGISSALDSDECRRRLEEMHQNGLIFEWVFRRADGSVFPVEITANRLQFEGNENFCLFARDISERRRAEELRQFQLQAARTLSTISLRFVDRGDVNLAVRDAVRDLMVLLRCRSGWLLRVDKEQIALEWQCMCSDRAPCGAPATDRLLPLLSALRSGEVQMLPGSENPALATVVVPLLAEKVLVGAIAFDGVPRAERWGEDDFPFLRVAARVITGAIQRHLAELQTTTLLEENRRLARQSLEIQESERAHLARELHDELGQCLTAIRADAQNICRLSKEKESRVYESAKAIGEVASRVYEVVRNMTRRLRPEMLDELGLGQALRDVVNQWRARHPEVEWLLSISGALGKLPEAVQITAFRVVQESMTNIVKHAQASRVEVRVERASGRLDVSIRDNGTGKDPDEKHGFGMLGMRERVLAAGGRFEVTNKAGKGYRVHAQFPLAESEEEAHAV